MHFRLKKTEKNEETLSSGNPISQDYFSILPNFVFSFHHGNKFCGNMIEIAVLTSNDN